MRRVAKCTVCKSTKYGDDLAYQICGVCRDLRSTYNRAWYHDHVERGLCTRCCDSSWRPHSLELRRKPRPRLPESGRYRMCRVHHIGALEYHAAWYERRQNQLQQRRRKAA